MLSSVIQAARFDSYSSAAGGGLGIFVPSVQPITINNVGFSVRDPAAVLYQAGVFFIGRLAIVRGIFTDSPDNFVEAYNLQADGYSTILDTTYTTFGGFVSFGGNQDAGFSLRGQGLTILIGPPTVVGGAGNATPVLTLYGSAGGSGAAPSAAAAAVAASASSNGRPSTHGIGNSPRSTGGAI